jgi:hypothetical protein
VSCGCGALVDPPPGSDVPDSFQHILTVLPTRLLLSDVSVTHCCSDAYVTKASIAEGSAAEERVQKKIRKYALQEPGGYDFAPLVVESNGRLCAR